MKSFKTMDPEDVWKLLEGHENVLLPAMKAEDARFKITPCPQCGHTGCTPFVPPSRPFVPGNPLPNRSLRCSICETQFDPYSGLIIKAGKQESDPLTGR